MSRTATAGSHGDAGLHTVLVVDDDQLVRGFVERALVGAGYRVISATSGAEALSLLHAAGDLVALVVTDLRMPVMSGQEATQLMAHMPHCPRILYMSGGDSPPGSESARFLRKPFTREALVRAVQVALHQPDDNPGMGG